jgi:hypothetical protein
MYSVVVSLIGGPKWLGFRDADFNKIGQLRALILRISISPLV